MYICKLFTDKVVFPCALLTTMILMLNQWGQLLLLHLNPASKLHKPTGNITHTQEKSITQPMAAF